MAWGTAGIVLALPIFGIIKIVFDHIEPLKPYGFLIGEEKRAKENFLLKLFHFGKKN
ncbi:hypothetical protein BH10BAC5_BH10BAC5_21660 [soil metagenome]